MAGTRVTSPFALAGLVTASFALRLIAAAAHGAPRLLPDEYIYFSLARSLAHGSYAIRGHAAAFPAFFEPLLAVPLWLVGRNDPEVVYRLTQGMHALVASLVAIPVYLVARRVGATDRSALVSAALSLALPALLFASFITADAVGLTLAVAAVAAGTAALDRPTGRAQIAFAALAGAATATRIQYAVLPIAFAIAALVVEHGRPVRVLATYRFVATLGGVAAVGVLAAGPTRVLGYYRGVASLEIDPLAIGHWIATDSLLLLYAAGWVLVPVALVGLLFGIGRPRSRAELGFASLAAALGALLMLEAAVYASNGSDRFQERYLIAILPLVPVLFGCGSRRLHLTSVRRAAAVGSLALVAVAAAVPLSSYTVFQGKQDSPTLQAAFQLESALGGYGAGSFVIAAVAGALACVSAACALRPRRGVVVVSLLSFAVLAVGAKAAVDLDAKLSARTQLTYVGRDLVDAERLGKVSVLETPFSSRTQISAQLFWNTSLGEILRMSDSDEVDAFGSTPVNVTRDGRIVADGKTVRNALLVEEYAARVDLTGAKLVKRTITSALWRPDGTPRLDVLTAGRYLDGWLGARSYVTIWPGRARSRRGVLHLRLSLPDGLPAAILDLRGPGVSRVVRVNPSQTVRIDVPVVAHRPWRLNIRTRRPYIAQGGRLVAVKADVPSFEDSP